MEGFDRDISAKLKRVATDNVRFSQEEKMAIRQKTKHVKPAARRVQPMYWTVFASAAVLFLFLGFIYATDSGLLEAGSDTDYMAPANGEMGYTVQDLEGIEFEIVEEQQVDEVNRVYTIELVNGTEHDIIDGVFRMSHPIKIENGNSGNPFEVDNRLYNIEAGKTIRFDMELPSGIFDSEQVELDSASLDLTGYLNKMEGKNIFQITRSSRLAESEE